jgi:hypothetical protein
MTRKDVNQPWTAQNVIIITREEHSRKQAALTHTGYRSVAQQKRRQRLGLPDQPQRPGRKKKQ